jgi:hypothetical protein
MADFFWRLGLRVRCRLLFFFRAFFSNFWRGVMQLGVGSHMAQMAEIVAIRLNQAAWELDVSVGFEEW